MRGCTIGVAFNSFKRRGQRKRLKIRFLVEEEEKAN